MNKKVLYCTIPFFGDEYHVIFKQQQNGVTSRLRGYGKIWECGIAIPKNVPVINFERNDKVIESLNIKLPREENGNFNNTLENYLLQMEELGIEVLSYKEYWEKYFPNRK